MSATPENVDSGLRYGILARSFGWSLGGDVSSKAAVLAMTIIAARALEPALFGQFIGLSATAVLAGALWDAGVAPLLTRELAGGRISTRDAVAQAFVLRLKLAPVWLCVFGAGVAALASVSALSPPVVATFGAASFCFGLYSVPVGVLRAKLRFRASAFALSAGRWLAAGLSLLALDAEDPAAGLAVLALALFAGEAASLCLAGAATVRSVREDADDLRSRLTLRASLPFATNAMLAAAYNRFDVVIVAALTTALQLSLYAPASRIQDALYTIPFSVGLVALPLVSSSWSRPGGPEAVRRLVSQLVVAGLAVSLPIALAVFLFAPALIGRVLGDDYTGAATATRVLVWFLPLAAISAPLLAALAGAGRAGDTTKVFAVAFVIAGAMHLSLDWWWGATGAAVASLSRDVAAVFATVLLARRAGIFTQSVSSSSGWMPRLRDRAMTGAAPRGRRLSVFATGGVPPRAAKGSAPRWRVSLFRFLWCLGWPVRYYVRRSPIARGKGLLTRGLLLPTTPPEPALFLAPLPGGGKIAVPYRDTIGFSLLLNGRFESAEIQCLQDRAKWGTAAVDVGANVGIFTIPLAQAVGPQGRVLAFEPVSTTVACLARNLEMNGVHNVDVHALALADAEGSAALVPGKDAAYASIRALPEGETCQSEAIVRTKRLDTVWLESGRPTVSVLKVDVEGAELAVLSGGKNLLAECRPVLLVEAATPCRLEKLECWLGEQGYARQPRAGFMPWNHLFVSETARS